MTAHQSRRTKQIALLVGLLLLFPFIVSSTQFPAGDVAPLGNPDGQLTAADLLILERFILGDITPTTDELLIADVAPIGSSDGQLNAGDLVVLQQAVLGLITLPDISIGPTAPVLFSAQSPTSINPYPVSGTADPGIEVKVYVNGQAPVSVTADQLGEFRYYATMQTGANSVYVTVWDGVSESDPSNTINIDFFYEKPTAVIGGPYTEPVNNNILFDGSGSFDRYTNNLTYNWDFGDGSSSTGEAPLHAYTSTGIYSVTLTVTAGGVTSSPATTTVTIKDKEVIYPFISDGTVLSNDKIYIFDGSTNGVYPGEIILPQLSTLTIEAGTDIRFDGYTKMFVSGTLNILGTQTDPVTLNGLGGDTWYGIVFTGTGEALIEHAIVEDSLWGVEINEDTSAVIKNSIFQNNSTAIRIVSNPDIPEVFKTEVKGNRMLGGITGLNVTGDARPLVIDRNIIRFNNTGIHLSADLDRGYPRPVVNNNAIDHNGLNYSADFTYPEQEIILDADDNWWGTKDKRLIRRDIFDSRDDSRRAFVDLGTVKGVSFDTELIIDVLPDDTADNPFKIKGSAPAGAKVNLYAYGADLYFAGTATANANGRFSLDYTFPDDYDDYSLFARRVENGKEVEESEWTYSIYYTPIPWWNDIPVIRQTITSPTSINPITVTVGTDRNYQEVNLYVNGVLQATASKTRYRDINFETILDVGTNTIHATFLTSDGESAPSAPIVVEYIPDGTLASYSGGAVTSDLLLPPQPAPYQITADIEIRSYAKLTLLAGAVLEFSNGARISAEGELNILGVDGTPVHLKSESSTPVPGDWVGVEVPAGANQKTRIEYALIEHASLGVWFNGGTATVDHSTLQNNFYGIYVDAGAAPVISNNDIQDNAVGLWINGASSPVVYPHNTITNNTQGINSIGTGLPGGNPAPVIYENNIFGNAQIDLLADDYFDAQSATLDVRGNWWGTTATSTIDSQIYDGNDNPTNSPTVDYLPVQPAILTDTSPITPTLDISVPSTSTSTYTVNGTAEPNREVQLYLNGQLEATLTSDAEGQFSQTVTLIQGSNTLYANAINGAEQSLPYQTYTVESDAVPPVITLTTPTEGGLVNYATFIGQLDETATLTVNGDTATVNSDNSFTHVLGGLPQGVNAIELIATDLAGNSSTLTVSFTLDSQPPTIPDTGQITVGTPNGGQVTVSAPAGNATAGDTVTLTNTRTGALVQATVNGDGSYAADIGAQAGDDIVVLITDPVGNATASRILQVAGTAPALGLTVLTPLDGSTVNETHVGVSGTFQGPANVGVTVNGSAAQIIGNTFCAGNASLEMGSNQLDVIATAPDGTTASQSLTVTSTGSSPVELDVDAETGFASHTVTFSLTDNTGATLTNIEYDVDSDGSPEYTTSDPAATFQHTYTTPGCYTATVTVTDDTAGSYVGTRVIAVLEATEQVSAVQAVYYQLLDNLRLGNIPAAVSAFTVTSQVAYESLFTEMQPTLSSIADTLGVISRTQVSGEIAEIVVTRDKSGVPFLYSVNLIRSESGIWRIEDM